MRAAAHRIQPAIVRSVSAVQARRQAGQATSTRRQGTRAVPTPERSDDRGERPPQRPPRCQAPAWQRRVDDATGRAPRARHSPARRSTTLQSARRSPFHRPSEFNVHSGGIPAQHGGRRHNMGMKAPLTGLFVLCALVAPGAVQMTLEPRAVSEAIAIGQSRIEADRTRFHAPYRVSINKAPVDFVEVVTPFRRVVLTAESRARIGDRSFGQRLAFDVLDAAPAQIDLWAEFTFHPLNTYVGVPAYEISLTDARGARIQPRDIEVQSRYGPRVEGTP